MKDLVTFLRACIDEDEASAREADATVLPGDLPRETHIVYGLERAGFGNAYQGFVLVHDPARELREVEAKRAILADCLEVIGDCFMEGTPYLDRAVRNVAQMAAVWSDHEGYRQEWRPLEHPG